MSHKQKLLKAAPLLLALLYPMQSVFADWYAHMTGDVSTCDRVMDILEDQGYGPIWRLELSEGVVKGKGIDPVGNPVVFHVDPRTAQVIHAEPHRFWKF